MKNLNRYFILFIVLGFLLGFVLYFRSFLIDNIIEPVAMLFWAIWRIATSIDQHIYWAVLIVLWLLSMLRLVPSEKGDSLAPAYNYEYRPLCRVEYWRLLIKDGTRGKVKAENLRDALKDLLCSIITQIDRTYPANLEQRVASEPTPLPFAAHLFLFPPEKKNRLHLFFHLPQWFQKWVRNFYPQDNHPMSDVLSWMEFVMEINHD